MASLRGTLRTVSRLSWADRRLAAEAARALVEARLRTLLPFRTLARQLGGLGPPQTIPDTTALMPDTRAVVRDIGWAVAAVAPWMPFRTLCLQQAVAARTMLARRGIASVLHLGIDRSDATKLEAHAWLHAGGIAVTGYPVDPALTEVGRFV